MRRLITIAAFLAGCTIDESSIFDPSMCDVVGEGGACYLTDAETWGTCEASACRLGCETSHECPADECLTPVCDHGFCIYLETVADCP